MKMHVNICTVLSTELVLGKHDKVRAIIFISLIKPELRNKLHIFKVYNVMI